MVAAGFTGGQADQLRRAMANWRRNGLLSQFKEPVITGMLERGHSLDFAERLFRQMQGFGDYGFPESHAASFALLVYLSAWLKCHHPTAFYCGLLNSQPMGFYSPSQLLQDAKRHGVVITPIDINKSAWDYHVEVDRSAQDREPILSLRIGFRQIKGFSEMAAKQLIEERTNAPFSGANDVKRRSKLAKDLIEKLIGAGAFNTLDGHKHLSHWLIQGVDKSIMNTDNSDSTAVQLRAPSKWEQLIDDYRHTGITLNTHPVAMLANTAPVSICTSAHDSFALQQGRWIQVAGIVTCRQRPNTASGIVFLTLEDHTGNHNIIVDQAVQERCRQALLAGQLLHIKGVVERVDPPQLKSDSPINTLIHIKAGHIADISHLLPSSHSSRNYH